METGPSVGTGVMDDWYPGKEVPEAGFEKRSAESCGKLQRRLERCGVGWGGSIFERMVGGKERSKYWVIYVAYWQRA